MRFLVRIDPNRSVTLKKKMKIQRMLKEQFEFGMNHLSTKSPKQTKRIIAIQKRMVSEVAEIKMVIPRIRTPYKPCVFHPVTTFFFEKNSTRAIRILRDLLSVHLGVKKKTDPSPCQKNTPDLLPRIMRFRTPGCPRLKEEESLPGT